MIAPPRPGFVLVATRELRWIFRDKVALFLMVGVPLIAFAVLGRWRNNTTPATLIRRSF